MSVICLSSIGLLTGSVLAGQYLEALAVNNAQLAQDIYKTLIYVLGKRNINTNIPQQNIQNQQASTQDETFMRKLYLESLDRLFSSISIVG